MNDRISGRGWFLLAVVLAAGLSIGYMAGKARGFVQGADFIKSQQRPTENSAEAPASTVFARWWP